ncbi:MAG: putative hydrolase [Solirubrobacterales bacterium]|nr:putative hydrolase [Solirubrobacterales bacterium]
MRSFLIVHGWHGSGPDHWQTWLAQRLAAAGEEVRYPDLPDPDYPVVTEWAEVLHAELAALAGERIVVCHSLGCLLWAHEAARVEPVDRLLLVAPPCPVSPLHDARSFYPTPLDSEALARSARAARVVGSDKDPYCPAGHERSFARPLGLEIDVLAGAGHINPEAGYGPWPAVEAWCYGAKNGVET